MIIAHMGISSDYNISYSIVGEGTLDGRPAIKLLATACPQRMVDSYQALFNQLGMKLKQINVSNNCISRLILNSPNLKTAMPFLCAQVDVDFVNINLYENGQVALSRYAKIDPADYENNPDYINIAVFDNLFRMIQFIGQRPNSRPLKQIMFYGIIKDFVALSNSIQSFNIPSHVLAMPNNIVKYCELDFSRYANAIGAFYRTDPINDHINLLQSKAVTGKKSANLFPAKVLLLGAATAALVFGARTWVDGQNKAILKSIDEVNVKLNDAEWDKRKQRIETEKTILENFLSYKYSVMLAKDFYDFQPRGALPQITEKFHQAVDDSETKDGFIFFDSFIVEGYDVTTTVYCNNVDFPADFVEALSGTNFFAKVNYLGFEAVTWSDLGKETEIFSMLYYVAGKRKPWETIKIINQDEIDRENRLRRNSSSPFNGWRELTEDEDGKIIRFEVTATVKGGHIFDEKGNVYEYHPDAPIQ